MIGQIVHFVMNSGPTKGKHLPGVIVDVELDVATISVFITSEEGYPRNVQIVQFRNIKKSNFHEPGTWHPAEAVDVVNPPPEIDVTTFIAKAEELLGLAKSLKGTPPIVQGSVEKDPITKE